MNWIGTWRNQYGSELRIDGERDGALTGTFRTALQDSGFFGRELAVSGIVRGSCINFAFGDATSKSDTLASFSGIGEGDIIETMWFVVSHMHSKTHAWPHAVSTNHDTFTRV